MSNLPEKKPGSVRLIAAADVHLGRVLPVPNVVKNFSPTTEGAWVNLIDFVLDPSHNVDALLLAGDIFDREENILEAPFFFEKGMRQMFKKNKPIIAIAGNHDWSSLRRRHRLHGLSNVHILGLNQAWESIELSFGSQTIRFEGWSFPSSHYSQNPLTSLPKPSRGRTTIGLLHGDWDGHSSSPYAPFSVKELAESGREAWVLGHVHIPKILSKDPYVISCGSLQGLDSSEHGERGCWLIDIDTRGCLAVQMIPIAEWVWQSISVDVTGIAEEDYEAELQRTLAEKIVLSPVVKQLSLEVRWKGRVRNNRSREILKKLEGSYFNLKNLIDCHLRESIVDVQPMIDLSLLADKQGIIGLVAREILHLNESHLSIKETFESQASLYPYLSLEFDHQELKVQALDLLFTLLEQKSTEA